MSFLGERGDAEHGAMRVWPARSVCHLTPSMPHLHNNSHMLPDPPRCACSNSDNLGATLDLDLLAYFASSDKSFVMEVAERTASDKKGGHLAKRKSDGRLVLRESAQCPDADKSAFEDVSK